MKWRLRHATKMGGVGEMDYVFEGKHGRRITLEYWASLDAVYWREGERAQVRRGTPAMRDAVDGARAYLALYGGGAYEFAVEDLGL